MEKKGGFFEKRAASHVKSAESARKAGIRAHNGAAEAMGATAMGAAERLDGKEAEENAIARWHLKRARRLERLGGIFRIVGQTFRRRR
ncbi:MAG: hypothetical protein PHH08_00045 [Candidatus ainarchaeum sp.]|nr:hypothetical protein [Candidatus ainarchaeum sp.]